MIAGNGNAKRKVVCPEERREGGRGVVVELRNGFAEPGARGREGSTTTRIGETEKMMGGDCFEKRDCEGKSGVG